MVIRPQPLLTTLILVFISEKIVTNSRENDPFKKIINGIMGQTEHLMRRHLGLFCRIIT